jgi:phosphate acetyltransferase
LALDIIETSGRTDPPPQAMAIVAANSLPALRAARSGTEQGVIIPVLVGNPANIASLARDMGFDLAGYRIVPADDEVQAAKTAVALARNGEVRALMKGHIHTDVLMRAVLDRDNGLRVGRRITHVFRMSFPDHRSLMITDAAITVAPDIESSVGIVRNAVELAHALGIPKPCVALLSAVEMPARAIPSSMQAREVQERLDAEPHPAFDVCGPLAFDVAVAPAAAEIKGVKHPVAGCADILVVPGIDAGNLLFKSMVHLMGATAAGIVLGARVPIVLTSRSDSLDARLASARLAVRMVATPPRMP